MNLVYNIEFDVAGLIIHLILLIILNNLYSKSRNNQLFKNFLIISFISGLLDLISVFTISYSTVIPVWINIIVNTAYLFCATLTAYEVYIYVYSCINYKPKIDMRVSRIIFYIYVVLLAVNLFTGIIFYFDDGVYTHGKLYLLNYCFPLYFFVHLFYLTTFKKDFFKRKQLIINSSILFFPIAAAVLQISFPSYLLSFFSYTLIFLTMLFSLETPDFEELEYLRHNLEIEVQNQTAKAEEHAERIAEMSIEIVKTLAETIDAKDNYTNGHSKRVAHYSELTAQKLGWPEEKIKRLTRAALLHDVGKIGIPDNILLKPGELTPEEFEIIKTHAVKGGKILKNISDLPEAQIVAQYHHERWDGKGYPEQLKGQEIPDIARVVSITDTFDAMNTKRIYRNKLPADEIRRQLMAGSGTQFDPEYLEAFLSVMDTLTL